MAKLCLFILRIAILSILRIAGSTTKANETSLAVHIHDEMVHHI